MQVNDIFKKAIKLEPLSIDEGVLLYTQASTPDLMYVAHQLRTIHVPGNKVTWQIDRNVNITNVCVAGCKFCNFHCNLYSDNAYITSIEEYKIKIRRAKTLWRWINFLLSGRASPQTWYRFLRQAIQGA